MKQKKPLKRTPFKSKAKPLKRKPIKKKKAKGRKKLAPTPRKKVKKECDTLWSKCVRLRDSKCRWCEKNDTRHAHHIFSRRYMATRHLMKNGLGLCGGCHMAMHEFPERARDEFYIKKMPDKYLELKKSAKFGAKITLADLEETLEILESLFKYYTKEEE